MSVTTFWSFKHFVICFTLIFHKFVHEYLPPENGCNESNKRGKCKKRAFVVRFLISHSLKYPMLLKWLPKRKHFQKSINFTQNFYTFTSLPRPLLCPSPPNTATKNTKENKPYAYYIPINSNSVGLVITMFIITYKTVIAYSILFIEK